MSGSASFQGVLCPGSVNRTSTGNTRYCLVLFLQQASGNDGSIWIGDLDSPAIMSLLRDMTAATVATTAGSLTLWTAYLSGLYRHPSRELCTVAKNPSQLVGRGSPIDRSNRWRTTMFGLWYGSIRLYWFAAMVIRLVHALLSVVL